MPIRHYNGCEGLDDDKLQKLRERFLKRSDSNPRTELEYGPADRNAEQPGTRQANADVENRSGKYRDRF